MEEKQVSSEVNETNELEPSKAMAFTIDFGIGKAVDMQRHKSLVEKYQRRHRRGESMSKLEVSSPVTQKATCANSPSKIGAVVIGQQKMPLAEDNEPSNKISVNNSYKARDRLSLPLKNIVTNKESLETNVTAPLSQGFELNSGVQKDDGSCNYKDILVNEKESHASCEHDKSDTASDTGTYTIDGDAYSEEQKARMSIDQQYNIQSISNLKKTADYVESLSNCAQMFSEHDDGIATNVLHNRFSPIVSPTQNISITDGDSANHIEYTKIFNKIMFPSPKAKTGIGSDIVDNGSVISITSSGVFRPRSEKLYSRTVNLTKSEIHVEAYTENMQTTEIQSPNRNLSANLVMVSEALPKSINDSHLYDLPPAVGGISCGKMSPTKIPSPIHSSRPRSTSSNHSSNTDLYNAMDTDQYLKPTEKLLNSLQQKLSLNSNSGDIDDSHTRYLNNDARNLLKKPSHMRHNSLDEKNLKISNKLEHFRNKKFIDQTNVLNQYQQSIHKIHNSPNNSPIRRSSSFSTKNQINTKCNISLQKETNLKNAPSISNSAIQRSASTAAIRANCKIAKPNEHKIDRNQYGDTESSSEEETQNNLKKKDITTTRYNRAFSLRRARLDELPPAKCPNTPEMRRKFQHSSERSERAISVDRKPFRTEVQSRYMQNITKNRSIPTPSSSLTEPKSLMKSGNVGAKSASRPHSFSRPDSGRPTRTNKPASSNLQKTIRKDNSSGSKNSSGPRSNSSLTSKEVEFQNWKRRKSYDPMKSAAEGKRKAELARKQNVNSMTQSYHETNQECDSSPSHSSSVHRSQSFHGTASLEQYISSDNDDLTLSVDEDYSPSTPSSCGMCPNSRTIHRTNLKQIKRD